jgi:hypothetical protein
LPVAISSAANSVVVPWRFVVMGLALGDALHCPSWPSPIPQAEGGVRGSHRRVLDRLLERALGSGTRRQGRAASINNGVKRCRLMDI